MVYGFMVFGFMGLWVTGYGFMGLWFMGYSKIESIKNPNNHLIIRILTYPDWTHVRIQIKEA